MSTTGVEGAADRNSTDAAVSGDGRHVAFSTAAGLVPGDRNGAAYDIVLKDLRTGALRRVSTSSSGQQANRSSYLPVLSRDGRFVAYSSRATNLVPGDTNDVVDGFVTDTVAGTTRRVTLTSAGGQAPADPQRQGSFVEDLSPDGRYVTFSSWAALVPGDTNGTLDVYVRDLVAGTTSRVSVGSGGVQSRAYARDSSITADGRYVAFCTPSNGLVPGDRDGQVDLFVRDRRLGTTTQVAATFPDLDAACAPTFSRDGRYLAFGQPSADGLGRIHVLDRLRGTTDVVPVRGDLEGHVGLSSDGRYVVGPNPSVTPAGTLVVFDRVARTVTGLDVSAGGVAADAQSQFSRRHGLSDSGAVVAFTSFGGNLVPGDRNVAADVFVRVRR